MWHKGCSGSRWAERGTRALDSGCELGPRLLSELDEGRAELEEVLAEPHGERDEAGLREKGKPTR